MALPNSDQILRAVIEATPDAIFVKDLDGRYVLVNAAAARFLGKLPEEIIGKRDLELYPEATARRFIEDDRTVLATGRPQHFEGVATGDDGAPQAYLVTKGVYRDRQGTILGLFGISHDITELRRAQETLAQTREALFRSQKMEAVGQLTGGIAHDFNNILAIILGNAELLRAYLPKDSYADEIIDAVLRATMHGRDLTGHLLAFSRRRLLNPQPVDVNALVAGIVRLLGRTLGASIQVTTEVSGAGVAFADPGALEAAVLNVALNARDAMPDGGTLAIRTTTIDITRPAGIDEELEPGTYVQLALTDTGSGMTPEVAARVFEPFFTTKSGGRGTGLGLSMVYGFAKQSGGTVTIQSKPGRGTTVTMLLPLAPATVRAPGAGGGDSHATSPPHTILVVEDEDDVRAVVRRQLETLGHSVLVADAGTEALLMLQGPAAPDLLIADVVLGSGMNGIELAASARRIHPSLPVIFISGYTAVAEAQQRIREMGAMLLPKPFTTPQLERAIQEVCATAAPRN